MWLLLSQLLPLFSLIKHFRGSVDEMTLEDGFENTAFNLNGFPDCGMSLPVPP